MKGKKILENILDESRKGSGYDQWLANPTMNGIPIKDLTLVQYKKRLEEIRNQIGKFRSVNADPNTTLSAIARVKGKEFQDAFNEHVRLFDEKLSELN